MAVQFKVKDNEIHANIAFSKAFQDLVTVFKKYHSRYNPSSHTWIIPIPSFEKICADLEEIEPIIVDEETLGQIEIISNPKSSVKFRRIQFHLEDLKVPPFKGKEPYVNYQLEDIQLCVNRTKWALFNEQGLGKSYEIISALEILRQHREIGKILFITSDSGVYNIKREFARFSNFDPSKIEIGGTKNREPLSKNPDIIICNYRSFLLISDHYYSKTHKKKSSNYRKSSIPIEEWLSGKKGVLVLDESQKVANPKARQTKALDMVKDSFERVYLLSGTPYDKEEKIYSQLNFLDSSFVHGLSYQDWLTKYADLGNRFSAYAINGFKASKKEELTKIVASTSSRRFADDCLNLPEHLIQKIVVPFQEKQESIYKEVVVQKLKALKEAKSGLRSDDIVNTFPYFILGIDYPKLLLKHEGKEFISPSLIRKAESFKFEKDHSKVEALLDLIEKHENEKIVIWTSHPSVGFAIQELLKDKDPLIINGECKIPKGKSLDEYKGDIVQEFENNPNRKVLIAGIQVFSTAVTLIAANVQIVFDSTFSFIDYSQALKRIHRIGQNKTVYTYILLIDNSLDMLRFKNLEDKEFINVNFLKKEYLEKDVMRSVFEFSY